MTWRNLPFLDRLRKVKEAGFSHYEFWPWRGKDIDAILKLNQELGLTPVQFSASPVKGFGHGITNPDPARREEFEEEIRSAVPVAKKLGRQEALRRGRRRDQGLFPRRADQRRSSPRSRPAPGSSSPRESRSSSSRSMFWSIIPASSSSTRRTPPAFLKAVGSPNVKMLFDIYHQQISEGNLTGNIRKYHDLIGYYQLADHPGRHEPTTGEINYPFVLWTIHDVGYRDPIGMEMSPKSDPMEAFQAIRRVDALARDIKGSA